MRLMVLMLMMSAFGIHAYDDKTDHDIDDGTDDDTNSETNEDTEDDTDDGRCGNLYTIKAQGARLKAQGARSRSRDHAQP